MQSRGYCDLCLEISEGDNNLYEILLFLHYLGYKTVALNKTICDNDLDVDNKKRKHNGKILPDNLLEPFKFKYFQDFKGKMHILNRITIICSDPVKLHTLEQYPNFKKYHIYAVVPTNQAVLQFACTESNADIIAIKSSSVASKLNRKLYQQAIQRNVYFEIQYADLLDLERRKVAIYCSHLYHTYGRSANVIISSGASQYHEPRCPYRVINLVINSGILLGIPERKLKAAILNEPLTVILRAQKRLCGKAIFTVETMKEPYKKDEYDAESEEEC